MTVARTSPPAKLNLFLEIPARRDDGYHEIDTVMVAIDWRDELTVRCSDQPGVRLTADWLPSAEAISQDLGLSTGGDRLPVALQIPTDQTNLVSVALRRFSERFAIPGGFSVQLGKRIPAGAGLGGASSDAAHAIACAARLHDIPLQNRDLVEVAASVGSDVPFFLGRFGLDLASGGESDSLALAGPGPGAARARGRGERLTPVSCCTPVHFVVAYPASPLSTAAVYGRLRVPGVPVSADGFVRAFEAGDRQAFAALMMNRLTEPAAEILPRTGELIQSLWQSGLQPCQLTGSGSACFGIARDQGHARQVVERLRGELQPGVLLQAVQMVSASAEITIEPS
ncbi:4-(cytidine 5'-diphospho)-2-C-methyl-D-erythritol kinase [Roseiconus nitratireducens]|uniref:4-diphosphocytidyl-2-C-methyl-D-erythritol kinase n=1 Tax=Roseiconus nitratireducens TaxID=2605748 RepID=A0A5M6D899_9BACT|nr:4-(cytidine 5'-diphospho)-2-C-methyl-D-erythritol kinase [Roseiconus nitratireducens]KAA5542099.1 4-(cytidine 5'-diphospho)-2-C-methyl-D-erythritol kinase [Roseiconus nitratireducens]